MQSFFVIAVLITAEHSGHSLVKNVKCMFCLKLLIMMSLNAFEHSQKGINQSQVTAMYQSFDH